MYGKIIINGVYTGTQCMSWELMKDLNFVGLRPNRDEVESSCPVARNYFVLQVFGSNGDWEWGFQSYPIKLD